MIAGVLGLCALFALYYLYDQLFGGPSTPPPVPAIAAIAPSAPGSAAPSFRPVAGSSAVKVGTVNGQLDPTLHDGPMRAAESLVYAGLGRNIFGTGPDAQPVTKVAQSAFPARPVPQAPVAPVNLGPPPPPPINLKFFGVATRMGVRRALLLSGDDVFLASQGDIVQRRYRIVSIAATSITIEDVPNNNQQSLPLMAN